MTSSTLVLARDDRRVLIGVVGFAVALAAASQVAIPIPGTPVPITLQPLLVVLAGLWLGPAAGAASMILYLVAGAAGVPVFAPIGAPGLLRLVGPTGGYLLAWPVAALVAGAIGEHAPRFAGRLAASALGILVIHLGGLLQLSAISGSVPTALALGTLPFLPLDLGKAILGALLSPHRRPRALP